MKKAIQKIKMKNPDVTGVVPFSNLPMLIDILPKSITKTFEELPKVNLAGEVDKTDSKLSEDEESEPALQVPTKSHLQVLSVEVVPPSPSPSNLIKAASNSIVKGEQLNPPFDVVVF